MNEFNLENTIALSGTSKHNDSVVGDKTNKAYELYEAGKYSDAIAYIENTPDLGKSSFAQVIMGNCFIQQNNSNRAVSCWEKAISINPLESDAYVNIANVLYKQGNLNEAILNWHLACSIKPENPTVNLNLAIAYNKKNSRIKATKYYERYLRYEKNTTSNEYVKVKHSIANLKAQAEFYAKKLADFKLNRNIQGIAAVYLKMIATYANLPNIYANIAEIFIYDKNYQKALEFYLLVYLNFPFTLKTLIEIANLCLRLNYKSYAYAYYKKALNLVKEGTSQHSKIKSKISSLSSVIQDIDLVDSHLQKAREAEAENNYEEAIDEYENYLILTDTENKEIQQLIDKYKIFSNPEPFVINVLYNQITDLMNRKKLQTCIQLCDRILELSTENSKEVVYAMKCKSECKRIILAQEHFGG